MSSILLLNKYIYIILIYLFFLNGFSFQQDTKDCNQLIKMGIDDMKNMVYVSAIKNLSKANKIAREKNWINQQFISTNNLGLTYYKMMDYSNALIHLLEAYELSLIQKNAINEMIVLNNIAILYIKEKKLSKAESFLLKSFEIAKINNNNYRIGLYGLNLAQLYLEMNQIQKAESYIKIASDKTSNESRELLNVKIVSNSLLYKKRNYYQVLINSLELLKESNQKSYLEEKTEILLLLSKTYSKTQQWSMVFEYSKKGILNAQNDELKIQLFNLYSKSAIYLNKPIKAVAAKDSIIKLTHKIDSAKNKQLLETTALRFELSNSLHALNTNVIKAKNDRKLYLWFITILSTFIIIIGTLYYKKNINSTKIKTVSDRNLRKLILDLEIKKNEILMLEDEIKYKNKELSDKVLFQTTRNELVENIIQTIINDKKINSTPELVKAIRDLQKNLKDERKWENYTNFLEKVNDDKIKLLKIKHLNLNPNDIRFISYIQLNLSIKEISSLLNISPASCRKRKERLSKKLNIKNGISLYDYVSQIT